MLNSIHSELFKLRKSLALKILLIINGFGCAALSALLLILTNVDLESLPEGIVITQNSQQLPMDEFPTFTGHSAFYEALNQLDNNFIFISIFIGLFIASEFGNRTIGLAVASGKSRLSTYVGKLIATLLGSLILLLISPLVMTFIVTIVNGFGVEVSENVILDMAKGLLLYIIVNLSITSLCILLAYIIKNMGVTIGVSIGVVTMLSLIHGLPFGESITSVLSLEPLYYGSSITNALETGESLKGLIVSVVFFAVISCITYISFKKTELK